MNLLNFDWLVLNRNKKELTLIKFTLLFDLHVIIYLCKSNVLLKILSKLILSQNLANLFILNVLVITSYNEWIWQQCQSIKKDLSKMIDQIDLGFKCLHWFQCCVSLMNEFDKFIWYLKYLLIIKCSVNSICIEKWDQLDHILYTL